MADIKTTKKLVAIGVDPVQSIALGVEPNRICIKIENELVTHIAALDPNEAIKFGVAMIQLATKAIELGEMVAIQKAGRLPPDIVNRG